MKRVPPDEPGTVTSGEVRATLDREERRLRLSFFHPKGNIITGAIVQGLRTELRRAENLPHLRLVTLEADGDDFSFGASVEEHAPGEIERVLPATHALIRELLACPAPTAAIVRGRCLGGGFELVLACDVVFAAESAVLGLPEIQLGVFPPAGSVLLPARVGPARATPAVLTGEARPAGDWLVSGLLMRVAPAAELDAAVDEWFATHLAPRSAAALRFAAAAVRRDLRGTVGRLLPEAEQLYLRELMQTHDAVEGIEAFMQKRPPQWTDR